MFTIHNVEQQGIYEYHTLLDSFGLSGVLFAEGDLELGGEARMNFPGTLSSANWTWRAAEGFDSDKLAKKIRKMTGLYGRLKRS